MVDTNSILSGANDFITANKQALAVGGAGAAGIVVGGIVGYAAAKRSSSTKKRKSRAKSKSVRKRSSTYKKKRKSPKYARTAGKRKDTSHRRIRMTKNGQPYIIMASGKARFISKKSARLSRKRKGGRY